MLGPLRRTALFARSVAVALLGSLTGACFGDSGGPSATASATDATAGTGASTTGPTTSTGAGEAASATTMGPTTTATAATGSPVTTDTTDAVTTTTGSTSTSSTTTGPAAPPECDPIAPSDDPAVNHANILDCLTEHKYARLAPGTFPIAAEIDMPDGSKLLGDETWPRLVMVAPAQSMVRTHDDCEVAFLRLDGNHNMTLPHNAIVRLMGNHGFVHDNHVQNADGVVGDEDTVTGVRFWSTDVTGNRVYRNQLHHLHYGVIFDLYPNGADNLLEDNKIYEIRCDGVTFRGYGRAHGNEIYRVGYQCLNPPESPIPGGCFYTLENPEGAELIGNHGYEACGTPLDLDRAARLVIRDNTFEEPGFVWNGHTVCGSGATAHLIDIGDSIITGNTFKNEGPATVEYDPNHVLSPNGSGVPSDLPSGANQAVAFMLTHRKGNSAYLTTHNVVEDNRFIANCQKPCVGLGYFLGRGTGYAADNSWSPETTNYLRRNDPFGSNIGSKRCGGNWYAADSMCPQGNPAPDCNTDDYQHEGQGHDWARNDSCSFYN